MRCSHKIKNSSLLCIFILSFTILSCSKDDNPVEAGNTNLDGIWTGTILSNLVTTPSDITISITQTNKTVAGTYSVLTGASGTISGTINNNSFNFTLTQTTPNCIGSFNGQGTISNTTITFTYSGSDCWGTHNGSGSVTKYNPGTDVICPLYVGISWTYIDSSFNTSGVFTSRDSSRLGIMGKGSYSYQGQNIELFYWNWINLKTNKPSTYSWLKRNDNDGLNSYGGYFRNQPSNLVKSLGNKFPVNAGDTWNSPTWSFTPSDSAFHITDTLKYTCLSTNEIFKTPAGNFSCYVYTYQRKTTVNNQTTISDTYLYFVKNKGYIGLVGKTNGVMRSKKVLKY
ncbi:MAG: hypothetical protein D4R68_06665 [Ignavibacteriales bacterium]|nr:MAG: hypothetical protein D4R68_06665 [Ignavibacteriales bacterium]